MSRSAALALTLATLRDWVALVPGIWALLHITLFAKLFGSRKYGMAADKILVTIFITIFFLPEFAVHRDTKYELVQFYYAMIIIENVFFIIPWNGIDFQYCLGTQKTYPTTPNNGRSISSPTPFLPSITSPRPGGIKDEGSNNWDRPIDLSFFESADDCVIDPIIVVIMVPTLTMVGVVMRIAASKKMSEFVSSLPEKEKTMKMEERIARLYSTKWKNMTVKEMGAAFLRMLRKEVIHEEKDDRRHSGDRKISNGNKSKAPGIVVISDEFDSLNVSQHFVKRSYSLFAGPVAFNNNNRDTNEFSFRKRSINSDKGIYSKSDGIRMEKEMEISTSSENDDLSSEMTYLSDNEGGRSLSIKRAKARPLVQAIQHNGKLNTTILIPDWLYEINNDTDGLMIDENKEQWIEIETPNGKQWLEMSWI